MSSFQSPSDHAHAAALIAAALPEAKAFLGFKSAAERPDGVIPARYRELISVAVALTTQCGYCIDVHVRQARDLGCSREEIAEAVFIAGALRAGAAVGHGLMAMRVYEAGNEDPAVTGPESGTAPPPPDANGS